MKGHGTIMKKTKQTLALVGVVLLIAVFAGTLIISIVAPGSSLFKAAIGCCIALPVMLYAFILLVKATKPKKSQLIDAIIFDVGNVLIDWDWRGQMKTLGFDAETIEYLAKHLIGDPLWNEFDRGARPYNDILDEFCNRHPAYESQIRSFIATMTETIVTRNYVDSWLYNLKQKGYELYILSNWAEPVFEKEKDNKLSFRKYMDGCIWSYQVKCIKPEPAIYKKLIKKFNLNPSRCVFLDDRQENLDAAAKFGMHTILAADHDYAIQQLRKLDVK